ncbi:MAG TPA: preprotein translocase subunit SecE [Candidatus Saccharibacteria bacterium]|nr:preprotein translocase subunit SecE [Candidatus Saccharibacteria bacterium]
MATKKKSVKRVVKAKQISPSKKPNGFMKMLKSAGGYFVGAWEELKQVRWPNRRTTWALSFAVIIFSAFFVALIVVLDYFFQWLFEVMFV